MQRESWSGVNPYYPREEWNPFDPMLISEGMFGAAMIFRYQINSTVCSNLTTYDFVFECTTIVLFSYLKTVHVFSISPHLGPLQISLGRMIIDIIKFFFIYMLVLVAFGCGQYQIRFSKNVEFKVNLHHRDIGLNQLMWYYADLERQKCYCLPDGGPDWENQEKACFFWRRFAK